MKTNKEWYEQHLPKEIAEKAVANAASVGVIGFLNDGLDEAIMDLDWKQEDGWSYIYRRVQNGEFDKPITETTTTPSISLTETIALLMEHGKKMGSYPVIAWEPLPGEESRIDLHSKNNTNDKV
jgi:hypothetical protein